MTRNILCWQQFAVRKSYRGQNAISRSTSMCSSREEHR
jgi:hypothetical protein